MSRCTSKNKEYKIKEFAITGGSLIVRTDSLFRHYESEHEVGEWIENKKNRFIVNYKIDGFKIYGNNLMIMSGKKLHKYNSIKGKFTKGKTFILPYKPDEMVFNKRGITLRKNKKTELYKVKYEYGDEVLKHIKYFDIVLSEIGDEIFTDSHSSVYYPPLGVRKGKKIFKYNYREDKPYVRLIKEYKGEKIDQYAEVRYWSAIRTGSTIKLYFNIDETNNYKEIKGSDFVIN